MATLLPGISLIPGVGNGDIDDIANIPKQVLDLIIEFLEHGIGLQYLEEPLKVLATIPKEFIHLINQTITGIGDIKDLIEESVEVGEEAIEEGIDIFVHLINLGAKFIQVLLVLFMKLVPMIDISIYLAPLVLSLYYYVDALVKLNAIDKPEFKKYKPLVNVFSGLLMLLIEYMIYSTNYMGWNEFYPDKKELRELLTDANDLS